MKYDPDIEIDPEIVMAARKVHAYMSMRTMDKNWSVFGIGPVSSHELKLRELENEIQDIQDASARVSVLLRLERYRQQVERESHRHSVTEDYRPPPTNREKEEDMTF